MQRVCGLHSISVDMTIKDCATYCFKSPEALTGLGAGMGTKLFGNPASHSGDEKRKVHQTYAGSQGADGKVETTKARAACNCKGWHLTFDQKLMQNSEPTGNAQQIPTAEENYTKHSVMQVHVGWPGLCFCPFHGGRLCACNPSGPVPRKQESCCWLYISWLLPYQHQTKSPIRGKQLAPVRSYRRNFNARI